MTMDDRRSICRRRRLSGHVLAIRKTILAQVGPVAGSGRYLLAFVLCVSGTIANGSLVAQTSVRQPHPFSTAAVVYEWHYSCPHRNPDGTCRFSILAASYSGNNVAHVQIVLAFQSVGSGEIPFYYFWITYMAKEKTDLVMLQSNAGVSFVAQGMTLDANTGPVRSEADQK
ncbi:hypothetical protein BBta_p0162 (plasmid) [Bradyrhizobium sp. BTAi1]|nr:hypothetical protein BBta_p0162 [Bradyrhizobium sp. BTAi1]